MGKARRLEDRGKVGTVLVDARLRLQYVGNCRAAPKVQEKGDLLAPASTVQTCW